MTQEHDKKSLSNDSEKSHIFIAEKSHMIAQGLQSLFRGLGYEITTTNNVGGFQQCQKDIQEGRYKLILANPTLMQGSIEKELIELIEYGITTPIILLSVTESYPAYEKIGIKTINKKPTTIQQELDNIDTTTELWIQGIEERKTGIKNILEQEKKTKTLSHKVIYLVREIGKVIINSIAKVGENYR